MAKYVLGLDDSTKVNTRLTWAVAGTLAAITPAAADDGSSERVARADHMHSATIGGTPEAVGAAGAVGIADSFVRSDHVHAKYYDLSTVAGTGLSQTGTDTPVVTVDYASTVETIVVGSSGPGTNTDAARGDHEHGFAVGAATAITGSNGAGSGDTFARANHDHAYGAASIDENAIASSALATSLVGGSGTAIGLETNTTNYSPTFSGSGTWTFPVDNLQITGTPDSANDVTNKSYVDSLVSGLAWKDPVYVKEYVGNAAALTIEGLTPTAGDAYVVTTANGAVALSTATVGDVWEYSGSVWQLIIAGSGGYVPAGVRALASTQTALIAPLTDATDDGKIIEWDGTSLTGDEITTLSGWAVLVTDQDADGDSIYANDGFVFEGTVPTGSWIQFTGAGQINAGAGLTKDGNTINVGEGNGISVSADSIAIDVSDNLVNITGSWNFTSGSLGLPTSASTTAGDIYYNNGVVTFYDGSNATPLWDDNTLDISTAQYATLVGDGSGGWTEDTGFLVNTGVVTSGTWHGTTVAAAYGGTGVSTWLGSGRIVFTTGATSALGYTGVGTTGQLLQSNGAGDPSWVTTAITPASSAQYAILVGDASTSWVEDTGFLVNSGVVTTGGWQGTAIGAAYGGTGIDTSGATGIPQVVGGTWTTPTYVSQAYGGTGATSAGWTGAVSVNSGTWSAGTLSVPNGGTGVTSFTAAGGILYASSTSLVGSTAAGTSGQYLKSNGAAAPTWAAGAVPPVSTTHYAVLVADASGGWTEDTGFNITTSSVTSGQWQATKIAEAYGGTNQSTYAAGDILYASASNTLSKRAIGSTGDVLTVVGGVPTWADSSAETTASNADDAGAAVETQRLVYYDAATDGYKEANGTALATGQVAGVTTEAQGTGANPVNVAYNGRVTLTLPGTHSLVTRGVKLYLAQEAGGYVVPAADVAYTAGYLQLPVAIALETISENTGGAVLGIFNPVGLLAVVL